MSIVEYQFVNVLIIIYKYGVMCHVSYKNYKKYLQRRRDFETRSHVHFIPGVCKREQNSLNYGITNFLNFLVDCCFKNLPIRIKYILRKIKHTFTQFNIIF